MVIHIFYHSNDLDGHCSGALLKHANPEALLHPINYGDAFPWDEIKPEDVVYMADFSLPITDMYELDRNVRGLIWIDHHKSAIGAYDGQRDIMGVREIGKAACELVWEWLYPDQLMPEIVHLLGRYDVWDRSNSWTWEREILPFQMGMRLMVTDPSKNMAIWENIFETPDGLPSIRAANAVMDKGNIVLAYQKQTNSALMSSQSYETVFEGHRALVCNVPRPSSQAFEGKYDPAKHDIMIAYSNVKGEYWTVSLYTDKPEVDCSELAKKYGGGGHRGAAGMTLKELPFKVI